MGHSGGGGLEGWFEEAVGGGVEGGMLAVVDGEQTLRSGGTLT